ncbi:unnamed protein product [Medioppia subpectinata]|uniref:DNA topoisomerase (ATP-hydrolyzing) n=1 Tax=Medioppia subpectinata TaxID=1979941 RepID=A0A7R9PU81_9ACAR|nr:unnamed protein product [Medioppia subpectinata]CAG2100496.1 unnamed protein product [Medioppia subpectinata]
MDTSSLRYGHIMIMTDQDHDGSHIKGLIINFLDHFFPSLLKIPEFLQEFITPIIRATKRNETKDFFTIPEYESFKERNEANGITGWSIKYYKGLGTSTPKDAKYYFSNLDIHVKNFMTMTDSDKELIDLAFNKKKADNRKHWLSEYEPGTYLDQSVKNISITDFVNRELILFSMADNVRSIPSVIDGFKPGQRKLVMLVSTLHIIMESSHCDLLDPDFKGIEPEHYVPIIPMVLVNGADGIGTGWSTNIPNYNPLDIVANIRNLIKGKELVEMIPWYRNFRGEIIEQSSNKFVVNGVAEECGTDISVMELPVGTWTQNYKEYLEASLSNGTIKHFKENFTEKITFNLKLSTSLSTSNMVCFDKNGKIKRLATLGDELVKAENKARFIKAVTSGKLLEKMVKELT